MGSRLRGLLSKAATITTLSGLVAGGVIALSAVPAAATPARGSNTEITPTSWSYVDSAAPHTSFVNASGNAPVGTQADSASVSHTTKSYYTFDISQFRGDAIMTAQISAQEKSVADCNAATTPQAWVTSRADHATWQHQPAEQSQLTGFVNYYNCPTADINWNVATEIQNALSAGRSTITIEYTLPEDQLANPDNWRSYSSTPEIGLNYDRAPNEPTQLAVGRTKCTDKPFYVGKFTSATGLFMSAQVTDPDPDDWGTLEFVFWPKGQPGQRTEIDSALSPFVGNVGTSVQATAAQIADKTEYDLQVRASDGTLTGPWSPVCQFITDLTSPAAPTVSSTDYPNNQTFAGGSGEPGTFVFNGNGDPNVVGFTYSDTGVNTYVAADHDGGTATVQYTPPTAGPHTMTVQSVDLAGDYSAQTAYQYYVTDNQPTVACTPTSGYIGVPRQCTFSPGGTDVVGYVYTFNGGPATTVAAGSDGTATATVTPTRTTQPNELLVQSSLSNGNLTQADTVFLPTDDGAPTITPSADEVMLGTPIQFTLQAVLPDSVSFTYTVAGQSTTVPVGTNGTATVTLTPTESGGVELDAISTTASGLQSGDTSSFVTVDSNQPTVSSDVYVEDGWAGGVGTPGTFTFSSPVPGVTSYTYSFNGAAPTTVPAGADGTANVVFTPTTYGSQTVLVTSTLADGSSSEQAEFDFYANS